MRLLRQERAQLVVEFCSPGLQIDCTPQFTRRAVQVTAKTKHTSQGAVCLGILGSQPHGFARLGDCVLHVSDLIKRIRHVDTRLREIRLEL